MICLAIYLPTTKQNHLLKNRKLLLYQLFKITSTSKFKISGILNKLRKYLIEKAV